MTGQQDDTVFQAEQEVLSAILMENEAIPRIQKLLPTSEFQSQAHRAIATAMYALHAEGTAIDPLTLSVRLEKLGTLNAVGGKDYIGYLIDATPTAANVVYHARIIRQDNDRRRAITFLTKAAENLRNASPNSVREIAQEAQQILLPLALEEDGRGFRWITKQDVEDMLHELDRRAKRIEEGLLPGISTGYAQIDRMTQGFRPGEFVLIGGVPKSMKTYSVLNILINAAYGRLHSGLVSGEMNFRALVERLLAAASLVSVNEMARGSITASERERLVNDALRLENYIAIDDEAAPQLGDVVARCTELKARQPKLLIIAVDYIQLVQNKLHGRRGDEEINEVCRALKALALKLEVVMLAPAQANYKEVEARVDKRCELRDFQGASGMVQYGDFVATIYNERQYSPDASPVLELNFQATRRTAKWTAFLDYDTKSMAIYEKKQHSKVFGESAA